ncbi:MAG: hypothetical protein WCO25_03775 [Candidatus Uhrbacteria bacterium]
MDGSRNEESDWFKNEVAEASKDAANFSPDSAINVESKTLLERLRSWSGYRYVAAFMLMARMSSASHEESHATIVDTGEKISESVQKETSQVLSGSEREMIREAAADSTKFLERAKATEGFRISDRALTAMAESNPTVFLLSFNEISEFSDPSMMREAAELAMLSEPGKALEADLLATVRAAESGKHPELAAVYAIADSPHSDAEKQLMMALVDDVHNGTMTVEQAAAVSKDKRAFVDALIRINARDGHLGKLQVDWALAYYGIKTLGPVNELHEEKNADVRFKSIEGLSAGELYTAITHFDKAYPSTYNGTFTRMLQEMGRAGMTGDQLLKEVGSAQVRGFLRDAIEHHRIDDFLATMGAAEQQTAMRSFVEGLDGQHDMIGEAAMVADALRNVEDPGLRAAMAKSVQSEYLRVSVAGNAEATVVYGVLSGIVDSHASWVPAERMPDYRVSVTREISPEELRNAEGNVVERYFFYDDEDGESSFGHFLSRFEGKAGWKVESHKEYVVVKSKGSGNGIAIYANRPAFEVSDDPGAVDVVGAAMGEDGVEATVAVHRGHVYHQEQTIAKLTPKIKVFFNGGCSGFDATESALKIAPDAHIISNQGTGTMRVNDAMLGEVERSLLGEAPIVWDDMFQKLGKTVLAGDKEFPLYVPPSKNFAAQFLVAYDHAIDAYGTQPDSGFLASAEERPDGA